MLNKIIHILHYFSGWCMQCPIVTPIQGKFVCLAIWCGTNQQKSLRGFYAFLYITFQIHISARLEGMIKYRLMMVMIYRLLVPRGFSIAVFAQACLLLLLARYVKGLGFCCLFADVMHSRFIFFDMPFLSFLKILSL